MTSEEKNVMRAHVARHISNYGTEPAHKTTRSPFVRHFFFRSMQFAALSLVIVLGGGGGLAFAAQDTLPGEALYNFKVNISEEVIAITKNSPQEKGLYAIERAAKRLDETTTLALRGELTHTTEKVVNEQITEHTTEAKKIATKAALKTPEVELEINSKIESAINPRVALLQEIKKEKNINGELSSILATANNAVAEVSEAKKNVENEFNAQTKIASVETVAKKAEQVQERLKDLGVLAAAETPSTALAPVVSLPVSSSESASVEVLPLNEEDPVINPSEEPVEEPVVRIAEDVINADEEAQAQPSVADKKTLVEDLVREAESKIEEEKYGEALVLLQQAEQEAESTITLIDLKTKIKSDTQATEEPLNKEVVEQEVLTETISSDEEISQETISSNTATVSSPIATSIAPVNLNISTPTIIKKQ